MLGFFLLMGALILLTGCFITNSPPVASFTASPSSGTAPLSISFNASSSYDSDGSIATYEWNFGDGGHGSGVITSHIYNNPGTYSAKLTVTDNKGAQGSTTHTIVVTSPPSEPLEILDWQLINDGNSFWPWVVVGHAKNVSGYTLSYAEVRANFYDAGGIMLTNWFDNILDLPAGEIWEFRIRCMDSEVSNRVDHATVSVGTCY